MSEWVVLLFIASTANWAAIEAIHHGSIFAHFRARWEVREGFFAELLLCPYCLSHWTALACSVMAICLLDKPLQWYQWLALPVFSLTVTRLSNLYNDVSHGVCRTPFREKDSES